MPAHATIPDPLMGPLRDAEYLVNQISILTDGSPKDVAQRLRQEHSDLGSNVRQALVASKVKPYVWSDDLLRFYTETDAFLFETIIWNRSSFKLSLREWIANHLQHALPDPAKVLSYGDGLGFDSFFFQQAGHDVDYYDMSRYGTAFASALRRDYTAEFRVLESEKDIRANQYDVVLCLDVLEHVPIPRECVSLLVEALRPDGRLIIHAPFWFVAPCVPTHLHANRRFAGAWRSLYGHQGLRPVDGGWFWMPLVLRRKDLASWNSTDACCRVTVSGLLLKLAKIWAAPPAWITRCVLRYQQKPWPELESLFEDV